MIAMASGVRAKERAAAAVIGVVSAMAGLTLSFHLDTPTGPTIVVCVTGIFVFSNLIMLVQHRL